jgi:hypothetical protein
MNNFNKLTAQKGREGVVTKRNLERHVFGSVNKRKVEVSFSGGDVSSDGGVLLVRQADKLLRLTEQLSRLLPDKRQPGKVRHSMLDMIRQRIYGLALGYEDLNDHDSLRQDPAWQIAIGRMCNIASSSTLGRMEREADRDTALFMHRVLLDTFIHSHKEAPQELILDLDATDTPIHGEQEGRFFNGYYRDYCYLPLYVTCGGWVLASYLRQSNNDAARHSSAIVKILVGELRKVWPEVKITIRADSGFCRVKLLRWCERHSVNYAIGIARNTRLLAQAASLIEEAQQKYQESAEKQRLFGEIEYAALTWKKSRRIIAKAEHSDMGSNPRFVITNLATPPQELYDDIYCYRSDMENRIKEQMEMFSERTSSHWWWPNQLRQLLSTFAYTLVMCLRVYALAGSKLAKAQVKTIRVRLLKVGVVISSNTKRIKFLLSSHFPHRGLYLQAMHKLVPG